MRISNALLIGIMASSAVLGGIAGGGIQANRDTAAVHRIKAFEDFDYDQCNWIVATVSAAPANWKEIKRTPGGNWCVSMQH